MMITNELNKQLQALDPRFSVWVRKENIFSDQHHELCCGNSIFRLPNVRI